MWSNLQWWNRDIDHVESMMAFQNGGDSSKTLDFFVFCNAPGYSGSSGGSNNGGDGDDINVNGGDISTVSEISTLDSPTTDVNLTDLTTITG